MTAPTSRNSVRPVLSLALLLLTNHANAQLIAVSGAGATPLGISAARDEFRADLGGGTVAGANGSFGGLRREINWDGVPSASAAPNLLAGSFYNVNSPRGLILSTPGTGFQASGASSDSGAGQPAAANFGNIDPTYTNTFQPFSPQRLVTPLGSNIFDVTFFVPGTTIPATVTGFGAVFADVDQANVSSIRYFDRDNVSIGVYYAPVFSSGLSFLGAFTTSGQPTIARVRVTMGNTVLGAGITDNNTTHDLVVSDDFIYGEPLDRIFANGFQ